MAVKIVRFVTLLLATMLAGNAVGSVVFVNPALWAPCSPIPTKWPNEPSPAGICRSCAC